MLGTIGGVYSSFFQLASLLLFFVSERVFFSSMIHKIYSVERGHGGIIANDSWKWYGPFGDSIVDSKQSSH